MTKPGAERASPGGDEVLSAVTPGQTPRFGRYQARSHGASYTAATDGFVLAGLSAPTDAGRFNLGILQGLVDGNLVAAATAGNFGCFDSKWSYVRAAGASSFLMPVPEGATWRVEYLPHAGSEGTIDVWVNWMPLGAAPSPHDDEAAPLTRPEQAAVARKPWEDFGPAIDNLVNLLESLFKQRLTEAEKASLADAMKRLI